ncbi:3-oxo-tetronate kinase [Microbacterium thalli]|uniref:3-oxo-tetronate kinase n=1 Tax=Microbacterium thalli TaxID=3027921 RepID=UPI0023651BC9|nr:3-oxo-tetronate kinase [Microbacterium thalli]MDD7928134.1 four-carbon acid sugar kinase family protein [Microbacterium thalli]
MDIGAVADDFTGATDLATTLRERGRRVVVVIEDRPVDPALLADADAVVVALKTRTAPVADAVAASLRAVDNLVAAGADRLYVKYCSTFDSTDEGNIGPVLDAVLARAEVDRTVVVPSFPANGRTVRDGLLYVGEDLLEDSSMRQHPLTPMTKSRVRDILAPQTRAAITEIPLAVVHEGVAALRGAIDEAQPGYLVVDAVTEGDLAVIAAASSHLRVLSGGAALAAGIDAPATAAADALAPVGPGRLVVCGSASRQTRAQLAHAAAAGAAMRRIDLDRAVDHPQDEAAAVAAWVRGLPTDAVPVVYSVGELADVRVGSARVSAAVETVLASVVAQLVASEDVHRILVAGGETSGAVVQRLGISFLEIGPQLAPGVCWSNAETDDGRRVALALKSGNFGADDLFTTAWEVLA